MSVKLVGRAGALIRLAKRPEHRDTRASLLGSLAFQGLGVVTGILLARSLGPTDRGVFAAIILWPSVTVAIGELGLYNSLIFYSAQARVSGRGLVGLGIRAAALQSMYLIPAAVAVAWIGLTASDADPLEAGLLLAAIFVPTTLGSVYVASILQGKRWIKQFYSIRISLQLAMAIFLLAIVALSTLTVWKATASYLGALMVVVAVSAVLARRVARSDNGESRLTRPQRREFVSYGLRSKLGGLYPIETLAVDQMLVALFMGPYALGLYVAANAFTSLPRLAAFGIGAVSMPAVAGADEDERTPQARRQLVVALAVLLPLGGILGALVPVVLPFVFGQAFENAVLPAVLLVASSLAYGLRRVIGDCLRGLDQPGLVSVVEVATWPAVVVAAAVGASFGLVGICVGLMIAQVLGLVGLIAYGRVFQRVWLARGSDPRARL